MMPNCIRVGLQNEMNDLQWKQKVVHRWEKRFVLMMIENGPINKDSC